MAAIDPALMEAAGFVGAGAAQNVQSGTAKAAVNTNQLNQSGMQARQGITDAAESRGMLRSSMTNRDLGYQTSDQANKQQLIDLGVQDTVAGANMDVMQELARRQAQEEAAAYQRQQFDAQMALAREQFNFTSANSGFKPVTPAAQTGAPGPGTRSDASKYGN